MTIIFRKALSVALAFTLALVGLSSVTAFAFAQEGTPPPPPSGGEEVEEVEGVVVASTTFLGNLTGKGIPGINGVLPGPGNQSAVLTSILTYVDYGDHESVWGKGKVEVFGSPLPLARAWTTLLRNGSQRETTYPNSVCWTSSSNPCESGTSSYTGYNAYWENVAETDVYWSGGGNSHGSAVASKQF